MVTFTLTPTNANERIPRNVVHLIVAEGVTEVSNRLCRVFESLESIVFSKSVTIIEDEAFQWCINLRSVIFPNDSQLREIRYYAFRGCESLQSIAIPDSVTHIERQAFYDCTNLEAVLFTDQSCLQEIGEAAFSCCFSLQSITIPKSVTEIGYNAFADCSKLKSVIFVEHSTIQTINYHTFCRCTSLQFINIPTTVTYIGEYVFAKCRVLQVIDIPHQAVVGALVFEDCHLLRTTLDEHGTDFMKGRFNALPIHQSCYKLNDTTAANDIINYFHSIQDNDPALLQVDVMGMTPLHILCANPAVTKDMIEQLYSKNTEAAAIRDVNGMLPWHMYAVNKDNRFRMFIVDNKYEYNMSDIARMILSHEFDADKLVDASLDIEVIEMYLIMTGSSLVEWLETANALTGLCPFMSMATRSNDYKLEEVYEVAMMNLNTFLYKSN
jgi:hypothetical protein